MTTSPKIRVLLAEDQTMLRGALAALLSLEPDITVIAQAANGNEALKLTQQHSPDIVVTDIEMPERTGLELAAALKDQNAKPRVIILTTFARPGYLRRALDAGARGYLLKERPASDSPKGIPCLPNDACSRPACSSSQVAPADRPPRRPERLPRPRRRSPPAP